MQIQNGSTLKRGNECSIGPSPSLAL